MDVRRWPFAVTNALARLLVPLLLSRPGRRPGRRLAVVEYRGRRTGAARRLVTLYALDAGTVRILVAAPGQKSWWRNFETPWPVRLHLAGRGVAAVARVVRDSGRVTVVAQLAPPADPGG